MRKLLVLARGDGHDLNDLNGNSVLAGLPFPVHVFADKHKAAYFAGIAGVDVEIVRWHDEEDVARRAARLHAEAPLLAIATIEELSIMMAASLRAKLGVDGLKPHEVLRFRDKLVMKRLLQNAGMRVPEYVGCDSRAAVEALLAKHGRIVLKPTDGLGSREVEFITSTEELDNWYRLTHRSSTFEAEEFIDGVLYHVNAIVRDGKPLVTGSAPYLPGMGNIDFGGGSPFVSVVLTEGLLAERLERFSTEALAVLGLHNGVTHMECFVTPAGEIIFCETAIRPGGGGIALMLEGQYGINYARATLLLEAGRGDLIRVDDIKKDEVFGLIGFRQPFAGFVKRLPTRDMFDEGWIRHVDLRTTPGAFVAAAEHCTDFTGLVVFSSANRAEFDSRRTDLYDRFYSSLEVEPIG